jgi:Tol biopolymer transport system component/tRNA A-37 threonylcarbamoyl transferase component Bud32
MVLSAGAKLGPYEILAPIGAGGMGEVYKARDTRLNRDVAIKISNEKFSDRFEREARSIATLNHSNICTLYDVGPNYLVMELIEGPTLADRIKEGAIPLEESLNLAQHIIAALEAAHEKGIVHRDLKPGNIKIKPDGTVKVLDFGLAKTIGAPASASPEDSPTISMAATQAGVILGTAAYMSPEQARGKVVDKRADIWAFGVVLYEMLTGKRLFEGEDLTETLASVVKEDPHWGAVPPQVRRLLQSCLEKDPKKRLRDIGDVWRLLGEPAETQPARSRQSWIPWAAAAAVLAVALGVALWALWRSTRPTEQPLVRLDVDLGPEISLPPPGSSTNSVIVSPDGARLVYVASVAGGPQKLFTRKLDQPNATELAGTEGATFAFFSPDGQWLGFVAGGKLNKISVEGGAVVPIVETGTYAASWGKDGNIVSRLFTGPNLMLIPAGGGAATPVTELADALAADSQPQILPGGKAVLFTAFGVPAGINNATIEVVSFADRRRKTLVPGGASPHYVDTSSEVGHLLYNNKGALFAIPFDLNRLETRGTAVRVLDGIACDATGAVAQFDVSWAPSGHGTLVYRKASGSASAQMTTVQWLDAAGRKEPLLAKPGNYGYPHLSPDGKRLALEVISASNVDIWVYDEQRDAMTRLTFGGAYFNPIWSPDSRYVAFGSLRGMFWTRADGAGQPQPFTLSKNGQIPESFSPDGKRLADTELSGSTGRGQIWTVPVEESGGQLRAGKPEQFLKTQSDDEGAVFSPDEQWLAYHSNESGKNEVYVRAFPPPASGQGGKWQISNSGGENPMWSRKGRELLYRSGDQMMAVKYAVKGDSFVPERPRVWVSKLGGSTDFDLAPDGKRLAVVMPVATPEAPKPEHEVTFLFNFFDYLRRRVPVDTASKQP